MKEFNIANIGTFDVENFGDLLFPEILKRGLSKRIDLGHFSLFSPTGGPKPFDPYTVVNSITDFEAEYKKHKYDILILGGGDIFRLDTHIAEFYTEENIPATQLLWRIASFGKKFSTPVVWNCLGVPFQFSDEKEKQKVRAYCKHIQYLCVRDSLSKKILLDAGVSEEIKVIPDTAVALSKYFPKDTLQEHFRKLKQNKQWDINHNFLVFQVAPGFIASEYSIKLIASTLETIKLKYNMDIVLFPIGYCHNDFSILKKIKEISPQLFHYFPDKLTPLDIMSVIASGQFFIGSSLHGNITAFSYGVNHIGINPPNVVKLNGFFELINQPHNCVKHLEDIGSIFDKVISNRHLEADKHKVVLDQLIRQIENHFDFIVKIMNSDS
jgi:polysaccharide pyruvyl transferase WcaK-like protein